jgi:hypothetical protein
MGSRSIGPEWRVGRINFFVRNASKEVRQFDCQGQADIYVAHSVSAQAAFCR